MIYAFSGALLLYLMYFVYKLLTHRSPETVEEFFSFGKNASAKDIRDAFFVTNASFATAFISLYLFVGAQGILSVITPLSFVAGCILFSFIFAPRLITALSRADRYPRLLGQETGSALVRTIVSVYVIVSLWLFTYTELHGFIAFTSAGQSGQSLVTPIFLAGAAIIFMGYYTSRLGFAGVVASDRAQRRIIAIGALALTALALIAVAKAPSADLRSAVAFPPEGWTLTASLVFAGETAVGFLFAQVVYYDNWQRIGAYRRVRLNQGSSEGEITSEVTRAYRSASIWLLVLYLVPISLATVSIALGFGIGDTQSIAQFIQFLWDDSIINKILIFFAFLYLSAALISTIEVYVVSIVNNILDDITGIMRADVRDKDSSNLLLTSRIIAFGISLSFLPALLISPNFTSIFIYLFYSANGLVGPILVILFKRRPTTLGVFLSLGFCALWPALPGFVPGSGAITMPGLLTVVVSCAVSFALSKRRESAS